MTDTYAMPRDPTAESRPACILVVDDEPAVRRYVRRVLEAEAYEVHEARDGWEAMERIQAEPERWDLVVSDILMPRSNGVELHEYISARGSRCAVILMSGYGTAQLAERGIAAPCGVLAKPFELQQLLDEVRRCLTVRT
jgi:DNA-binding NtrC family response regulator